MKNNNIKQLAIGLILGVALVTAIGAMVPGTPAVGRFQLGTDGGRAIVIDTMTGQIWSATDADFAKPKAEARRVNF